MPVLTSAQVSIEAGSIAAMTDHVRSDPRADAPLRTIDRDELRAKLERGEDLKLVMALSRWACDAKHIPGSLHFEMPDDLVRRGYRNVRRYAGGLLDWEDAGLPLDGRSVQP